jgi:glutaredoxin
MFFIYGALNSKASERAEILLYAMQQEYRFYAYGRDYTLAQLRRLVPGADSVPQIFYGTQYIGGIKELYEYINASENCYLRPAGKSGAIEDFLDMFAKDKQNRIRDTKKEQ